MTRRRARRRSASESPLIFAAAKVVEVALAGGLGPCRCSRGGSGRTFVRCPFVGLVPRMEGIGRPTVLVAAGPYLPAGKVCSLLHRVAERALGLRGLRAIASEAARPPVI